MNNKRGPSGAEHDANPASGIPARRTPNSARNAEEDFEALLAAASKALQRAVAEKPTRPQEKAGEEPWS
ncbi:MAG: hypothetical protein ABSG16_15960 [Candidatus Acidiferrum sp.]|jgi:hypothetical protein